MTPEEFTTWAVGGTAALTGLAVAIAKIMEALGLRPTDRRADQIARVKEAEAEVERYRGVVAECRKEVHALRSSLNEERLTVALLERLLTRQGWRKADSGEWEDQNGGQHEPG